jgi:hypothetical protein
VQVEQKSIVLVRSPPQRCVDKYSGNCPTTRRNQSQNNKGKSAAHKVQDIFAGEPHSIGNEITEARDSTSIRLYPHNRINNPDQDASVVITFETQSRLLFRFEQSISFLALSLKFTKRQSKFFFFSEIWSVSVLQL